MLNRVNRRVNAINPAALQKHLSVFVWNLIRHAKFATKQQQVLQQEAYPAIRLLLTPKTQPSLGLSPKIG